MFTRGLGCAVIQPIGDGREEFSGMTTLEGTGVRVCLLFSKVVPCFAYSVHSPIQRIC